MFCGFETAFSHKICVCVIIVQETLKKEIRLKQVTAFHQFFLSFSLAYKKTPILLVFSFFHKISHKKYHSVCWFHFIFFIFCATKIIRIYLNFTQMTMHKISHNLLSTKNFFFNPKKRKSSEEKKTESSTAEDCNCLRPQIQLNVKWLRVNENYFFLHPQ